jgi:hypothetical protein
MIEWLGRLPGTRRKILIHINNTNPILDEEARSARARSAAGIEVCPRRHGDRTCMSTQTRLNLPWSHEEFEAQLRDKGSATTSTTRSTSC